MVIEIQPANNRWEARRIVQPFVRKPTIIILCTEEFRILLHHARIQTLILILSFLTA